MTKMVSNILEYGDAEEVNTPVAILQPKLKKHAPSGYGFHNILQHVNSLEGDSDDGKS